MRLIRAACAFALALAPVARAQTPGRWSDPRPSPFTIVLDSADLAEGRGRSLAAFLAGRVTGLFVSAFEFPGTQPPGVVSSTTSGSFARPEPRLYIDGVHMWDDPAWGNAQDLSAYPTGQRPPSLGWGIPVDEIAEVRVILGPAGAGEIRYGAPRGAVLVTTRKGSSIGRRIRASTQMTAAGSDAHVRTNYGLRGFMGGSLTDCRRADVATGDCLPVSGVSWAPLAELLPARGALGVRNSVGVSGPLFRGVTFRADANDDASEGVLAANRTHRTDLSASAAYRVDSLVELEIDWRYARLAWKRGGLNETFYEAWATEWGAVPSDSVRDLFNNFEARTFDRALERKSERVTIAGRIAMHLTPSTQFQLAVTGDHLGRWSYADELGETRCNFAPPGCVSFQPAIIAYRDNGSATSHTYEASARHRLPEWRSLRVELRAATERGATKLHNNMQARELPLDAPGTGGLLASSFQELPIRDRMWEVGTRVLVGERGVITATRRKGAYLYHLADGEWDILRAAPDRRRLGLDRLTALAAYGEGYDVRSTFPVKPGTNDADFPRDFTTERRFGLAAEWSPRFETAIDRSTTSTKNGTLWANPFSSAFDDAGSVWYASWRVEATQVRIGLRSTPGAAMPWRVQFGAVERIARLTDLPDTAFLSGLSDGNYQYLSEGGPMADIWSRGYSWADTNGDGVIIPTEVTPDTAGRVRGSTEPRWTLTFVGGLEVTPRISIGAVVESRLGQVAFDRTGFWQCMQSSCAALYSADASLAAQAAAMSASAYGLSSAFVHDASFVRARELFVEYRFGDASRWNGVTLRLIGHNLFTLTRFPDDPEGMFYNGAVSTGVPFPGRRTLPAFTLRVEWQRP